MTEHFPMYNSTVKSTRDFWRTTDVPGIKSFREWVMSWHPRFLRTEEEIQVTINRINVAIAGVPKRPRFGHWMTMYWACKRLALQDDWWYTQVDLSKKLWREDLLENSDKHRS